MEGSTALRWVRALTLASVMLGSGIAGHAAAGGAVPATSMLLSVFVLLTAAIAPLLDAPATTRRVTALLLVGQISVHVLLQLLGGSVAIDVSGHSMAMHAGVAGEQATAHLDHAVASAPTGSLLAFLIGPHVGMLLAHVGAALVVGLWLAAGERAAWILVSLAALPVVDAWVTLRQLSGAVQVAVVIARPVPCPGWGCETRVRPAMWTGRGVSRRGPPRRLAA
jgi:hypothetical protein